MALAEKLQDYVDRNLVRASTTKMAQSRRKQLEKLEITEAPKDETNQLKFRFEYDVEPWNELVLMKNLTIRIGERTLLEPFTYTVCRGSGWSLRAPTAPVNPPCCRYWTVNAAPPAAWCAWAPAHGPASSPSSRTASARGRVIDAIWNKYPRMTELEVRSHLARLGFRGETVFTPCEALSGGELARLRFAEIVLERPNLLFLDEPTNHLDIYTRENLTEALMAYTGTLLMVTHDRHLMNSLGCPILYLENGKATLYPSYDALMGRSAPAAAQTEKKSSEPAKAGYGKEQRRRRAALRAKIKACEDEMEACGAREVELDNEINSPEVYNDPQLLREKSDELSDLRFHQDELFAAWEKRPWRNRSSTSREPQKNNDQRSSQHAKEPPQRLQDPQHRPFRAAVRAGDGALVHRGHPRHPRPLPGMKLGLANIVVMYALFFMGPKQALVLDILKALFVFLVSGWTAGFPLSLCGGLLSLLVMWLLYYHFPVRPTWFILSVCGALAHNIGQLLGASVILSTAVSLYYAPVMLVLGLAMGALTSITLRAILPALGRLENTTPTNIVENKRFCICLKKKLRSGWSGTFSICPPLPCGACGFPQQPASL